MVKKLFMGFLLVNLIQSFAFSQTALPVQKPDSKSDGISNQTLEAQSKSADLREKEAEFRADLAKTHLKELEHSGDKSNSKALLHKQLDLEAELARAELDAAQARAEAVKCRTQSAKDGAKIDSIVAAADKEVFRKSKIAVDAIKKAQVASNDFKAIEAKEAVRQTKIAELESLKSSDPEAGISPIAFQAMRINAEAEKEKARRAASEPAKLEQTASEQASNREAAEREAAQRAKAARDAALKARQIADEKNKAQIEAAQRAKAEQETLQKTQAAALELKIQAAKEAFQRAVDELEAIRKAQGIVESTTAKAERVASPNVEIAGATTAASKVSAKSRTRKTMEREIIHDNELFQIYIPRTVVATDAEVDK